MFTLLAMAVMLPPPRSRRHSMRNVQYPDEPKPVYYGLAEGNPSAILCLSIQKIKNLHLAATRGHCPRLLRNLLLSSVMQRALTLVTRAAPPAEVLPTSVPESNGEENAMDGCSDGEASLAQSPTCQTLDAKNVFISPVAPEPPTTPPPCSNGAYSFSQFCTPSFGGTSDASDLASVNATSKEVSERVATFSEFSTEPSQQNANESSCIERHGVDEQCVVDVQGLSTAGSRTVSAVLAHPKGASDQVDSQSDLRIRNTRIDDHLNVEGGQTNSACKRRRTSTDSGLECLLADAVMQCTPNASTTDCDVAESCASEQVDSPSDLQIQNVCIDDHPIKEDGPKTSPSIQRRTSTDSGLELSCDESHCDSELTVPEFVEEREVYGYTLAERDESKLERLPVGSGHPVFDKSTSGGEIPPGNEVYPSGRKNAVSAEESVNCLSSAVLSRKRSRDDSALEDDSESVDHCEVEESPLLKRVDSGAWESC